MSIAGKLGKVIARAVTSGKKKLSKEQKAKRKAYLDSYSPEERVKRNKYKKTKLMSNITYTKTAQRHGFHLVDPSPWPLVTSFAVLSCFIKFWSF